MTRAESLPVVRAAQLEAPSDARRWLIQSLWARAGVGILGGAPKCCKSWLALELAVSVSTGSRCLDTFAVDDPGSVLVYMAEDDPGVVKARLGGLCAHRGLSIADVPIDVITAPALRIDQARDQARLAETVRRHAPRLLVLDPFVRIHRIDENDAGQVSAVLGYLRDLQRRLDLAVVVVHHARKNGTATQAGQALRGSSDLHAWGDSNLYLRRQNRRLTLTIEHRAARAPDGIALDLVEGPVDGHAHLRIADNLAVEHASAAELALAVVATLTSAGEPLGRSVLRARLRVRNERLGDALEKLESDGAILRHGDRWAVPALLVRDAAERNGSPSHD